MEASLIFPLVVFTVLFIVYSSFYLHNVTVIEGAAYELAIYGTMLDKTDVTDMKAKMQEKYKSAVKGRLISMDEPQMNIEVEGDSISVSIKGTMHTVPTGLVSNYNNYVIHATRQVSYNNVLNKIRILKVIDKISSYKSPSSWLALWWADGKENIWNKEWNMKEI